MFEKKKTQSKTTEQQCFKDIMCESRIQLRQALAERVNHRRALLFVPWHVAELAKKNTIYWWTWNIKELTIIWITLQRSVRRRNIYLGTTFLGWDYLHLTFRDTSTIENQSLTPKIQSRADFYESAVVQILSKTTYGVKPCCTQSPRVKLTSMVQKRRRGDSNKLTWKNGIGKIALMFYSPTTVRWF